MGYHDGADLFSYVANTPIIARDPKGLVRQSCNSGFCGPSITGNSVVVRITSEEDLDECLNRYLDESLLALYIKHNCPLFRITLENESHPDCKPIRIRDPLGDRTIIPDGTTTCGRRDNYGSVVLCRKRFSNCQELRETLEHELMHLYDCCQGNYFDGESDCEACLCRELRAYRYAEQCVPGGPLNRQGRDSESACLCTHASGSCRSICNRSLEEDAVYCLDFLINRQSCYPHSIIPTDRDGTSRLAKACTK